MEFIFVDTIDQVIQNALKGENPKAEAPKAE
jgi:hypothetical protein